MDEYRFLHVPADAVHVDDGEFADLPPSARRVFDAIRDEGPVTHEDLREATGMPPRTIRYALKRLREARLVDLRSSLRDCRTCYFFVHPRTVGDDALADLRHEADGEVLMKAA